jgi:hypothetical protein
VPEAPSGRIVNVLHRAYAFEPVPALERERLLVSDVHDARLPTARRFFWLLDYSVQIVYEPYGWDGEWRCDLVQIDRLPDESGTATYRVVDRALDIIVEGRGNTYRILDLDDLGARLLRGEYSAATVEAVLRHAQRFVDAFLHRGAPWPPPPIREWFSWTHDYPPLALETASA